MSAVTKLRLAPGPLERFDDWFVGARPGSRHAYHDGQIATDAQRETDEAKAVQRVRNRVNQLVERGEITVVHERVEDGRYRYVAVRTDGRPRTIG